jgi:hypothetical protein
MTEEPVTTFFIVSREVEFQETKSTEKYAVIEATVMELEKPSGNNRVYQFEEGDQLAKSLIGKPVYYGTDPLGRHDNPLMRMSSAREPVGLVESASVIGNKIRAIIKIINSALIETLKRGTKYLFSVGGNAVKETIKKIGDKLVHVLHGAKCNHLQILDVGTPIGFPDAKMEKIIEIQETVMICENGVCHCGNQKPQIPEDVFEYHSKNSGEWYEES